MAANSDVLHDTEFIAFDLETTGLHAHNCHIVEFGAVRFRRDGTIKEQFQQLVNPGCEIPDEAIAIHGITNEHVAGQPSIRTALPRFVQFLGDSPVVMMAHNATFDLSFLSAALGRLGHAAPPHPVIDTLSLARQRLALRNYRLETIGRHLHLIRTEQHRALDDAQLLMEVFLHLVGKRPALRSTVELFALSPTLRIGK